MEPVNRNAYFIMIGLDMDKERFMWLESELEKGLRYKHRFVVMHHSPISFYDQFQYRPEPQQWQDRFRELFEKYKVDIVFSGHAHMYGDTSFNGVRYIVSGGSGIIVRVPASAGGFLHYVVVKVSGDSVDCQLRRVFPPLWEYLAYYIWKDARLYYKQQKLLNKERSVPGKVKE